MTGISAYLGLPHNLAQQIFTAATTEAALALLKEFDMRNHTLWQAKIYQFIANRIEQNAEIYISKSSDFSVKVGAILFDRSRKIISIGNYGKNFLNIN